MKEKRSKPSITSQEKRTTVVVSSMLITLAFIVLLMRDVLYQYLTHEFVLTIASSLILVGIAKILMGYLSGHFDKDDNSPLDEAQSELQKLREIRKEAEDHHSKLSQTNFIPTEQERKSILDATKESLQEQMSEETLKQFELLYSANALATHNRKALAARFMMCRNRLEREVSSLNRRGNVNLTLGFIATCLALGVLAWISFQLPSLSDELNWGDLVTRYLPRVTLAIFIQVFAFFFLRLHKSTLTETKYFQNEITNLDMYGISLEAATHIADDNLTKELCVIFAKIDRNTPPPIQPSPTDNKAQGKTNEQLLGLAKDIIIKLAK